MSNVVQPVSLVDADIAISASNVLQAQPLFNSAGQLVNPVAGTVLADTGQLAAGNFTILALWGSDNTATQRSVDIQHRNAANAANIWAQLQYAGNNMGMAYLVIRDTFAVNERLRIIQGPSGSVAAEVYQATLFWVAS